jgi:hypothetical protein
MNSRFLPVLAISLLLLACGSSKKFQASFTEDKPLFDAINALNKKPGNEKAQRDLKILYPKSVERHEEAIDIYRTGSDENKWDKILRELNALQHIYNSLQSVPGSFGIIKPKNYLRDIETAKQSAAEDFYSKAEGLLIENDRQSSLQAWDYFKRANNYVNGYKDVSKKIREAYEKAIVDVVVGPIEEDNGFFPSNNWNSFPDFRYRPQDYQEQLVRELGGRSANYTPARFYTDRELRREDIKPDWEINMRWRSLNPIRSIPRQYSRKVSKSIEIGKDTSGRPVYNTVYATLYITENSYSVQGDFEYKISDLDRRTTIDGGILRDEVNWIDQSATYTGDSRALSAEDWRLVNNRTGFNQPTRGEVMNNLMRKIFPDLRRRIEQGIARA